MYTLKLFHREIRKRIEFLLRFLFKKHRIPFSNLANGCSSSSLCRISQIFFFARRSFFPYGSWSILRASWTGLKYNEGARGERNNNASPIENVSGGEFRLQAAGCFDRENVDNRQFRISKDNIGTRCDQHVIRCGTWAGTCGQFIKGPCPWTRFDPQPRHLRVLRGARRFAQYLPVLPPRFPNWRRINSTLLVFP